MRMHLALCEIRDINLIGTDADDLVCPWARKSYAPDVIYLLSVIILAAFCEKVPIVCVSLDGYNAADIRTRSAFGDFGKAYAKFFFDDGKVQTWPPNSGGTHYDCGAWSPFTEIMKR
jgi:hypothetical protein